MSKSDTWTETRWSVIRRARSDGPREAIEGAWADLVQRYEEPIRRSVLRLARSHPRKEEIADGCFGYIFERGVLARFDPSAGRFRCYLQGVIRRYVLHEMRKLSRPGWVSVDGVEACTLDAPGHTEEQEEADWAMQVLRNAAARMLAERSRRGEMLMKAYGIAPYRAVAREDLCREFSTTRGALNVALCEARGRLRDLIRQEVVETVGSDEDCEAEVAMVVTRLLGANLDFSSGEPDDSVRAGV